MDLVSSNIKKRRSTLGDGPEMADDKLKQTYLEEEVQLIEEINE